MSHHLPAEKTNEAALAPPCQVACPVHQGIREYLYRIATADVDGAIKVIRETNPLPSICGTICAHHCEDECRRNDVDKPVSVRGLKRFAVEKGTAAMPEIKPKDAAKKVAVIGGGPAGLTAAWDLALEGCAVTVFDREKTMGGAVRHYIPHYRLPDGSIDKDIEYLEKAGIEIKGGVELGKDISIADLKAQGYKAIILAMGLPLSRKLPIPGADNKEVMLALPFLQEVKREDFRFTDSPTVIVIGGGNVAMDVARSAVRCGAGKVKVVCLESKDEMPAFSWEIEEAHEEGVEFLNSCGPESVLADGDNVCGLQVKECTCVFDPNGNFCPEFNDDNLTDVEGDIVIFSIGQAADVASLKDEIEINERGNIVFDRDNLATPADGVFACGEVAMGPGTAVQAMATGRQAALSVLAYLNGKEFSVKDIAADTPAEKLDGVVTEKVKPCARQEMVLMNAEARKSSFNHIEECFTIEQALTEAKRCLACLAGAQRIDELCANCLTCLRICPYGVPVLDEEGIINIRKEQCQACGLCMGICPNQAIEFRSDYIEAAAAQIEGVVNNISGSGKMLVLSCAYGAYSGPEFVDKYLKGSVSGVGVVRFPCVSKIDSNHILKAFEAGADSVLVAGCNDDDNAHCPYRDSSLWAEKRVGRAKAVLGALGLDARRVMFVALNPEEIKDFEKALADVRQKMAEEEEAPAGKK